MDTFTKTVISSIASAIAFIILCMWIYPQYNVWSSKLAGEALLAKATQERQIQIEQAKAELESAQYRADAIAVVGAATAEFPEYRKAEFIGAFAEALQNGTIDQIIYIPTEAGIPITEAGRAMD